MSRFSNGVVAYNFRKRIYPQTNKRMNQDTRLLHMRIRSGFVRKRIQSRVLRKDCHSSDGKFRINLTEPGTRASPNSMKAGVLIHMVLLIISS